MFLEKPTSISMSTCLLDPFPKVPEVQEAIPIKKNEKRTLETFLAKSPLPLTLNLHTSSISKGSRSPRSRPYKKNEKRTLKTFLAKSPLPLNLNLHTGFISKGSRSPRGRPYKEEREKNVRNVLSEISTPISSKLAYWVHFQRFRKSEAVPIKKKKKIKKSKFKKKIGNY